MFFELIRIAIGQQERLRSTPTAEEWKEAYDLAQRQTLTGIAFCGVQRLPEEQRPPRHLLMKWYMAAEQIRRKNEQMDRRTLAVANKFAEEGFPGVVLKGQGVAQLYRVEQIENSKSKIEDGHESTLSSIAQPSASPRTSTLGDYRTPGDIDIWLFGERKDILRYVRRHVPNCKPVYHHVDFPVIEGLPIEVHFTPSWMNSPFTNRRLQRWFKRTTVNVERGTWNDEQLCCNVDVNVDANQQSTTAINQRPGGAINRAEHFNRSGASLTGTEGAYSQPSSIDLDLSCQRDEHTNLDTFTHTQACAGQDSQRLNVDANQQSMTAINQRPGGAINRAEHFNRSAASLTGTEGASMIPTPTLAFNRVYILVHIYRHLFHEGIGLRQLLDYYFVLHQGFTEEERTETMRTLRSLRMQRFTAAVMWVLQEVFAMDDRYLLTDPNEEEGRFLLSEIMLAGNFGHYDERIKRSAKVTEWGLFCRRVGRNLRFLRSYPSEVLWSPFFKLWHAVFRFAEVKSCGAAVNRNRRLLVNRSGAPG